MDKKSDHLTIGNVEDILALTPLQKNMLYSFLLDESANKYYEQWRYKIKGDIILHHMVQAWQYVIYNNEMLRCIIRWRGFRKPIQMILKEKDVHIDVHNLKKVDSHVVQYEADKIALKEWEQKVDLQKNPFRVTLTLLSEQEWEMIITSHHMILDGWSNANLLRELFSYYDAICAGKAITLSKKTPFKAYIKQQQSQHKTQNTIDYWTNMFRDYPQQSKLVKEYGLSKKIESSIEVLHISEDNTNAIHTFCKLHNITMSVLWYAAWAILIHKYYHQSDVVFGVTLSGRNMDLKGIQEMVGLFIRTLPFRLCIKPSTEIMHILKDTNRLTMDMEAHKDVELTDLMSIFPYAMKSIMNTIIVIQNYPIGKLLHNKQRHIQLYSSFYEIDSDITVGIKAFGTCTDIEIAYNQDVFQDDFMQQLLRDYYSIMMQVVHAKYIERLTTDNIRIHHKKTIKREKTSNTKQVFDNLDFKF